MKVLGLDLGDKWIGIAMSDASQITCRPYKTATVSSILQDLTQILATERVEKIIIGLPRTMTGTESEQTTKVRLQAETLMAQLNEKLSKPMPFSLIDERLSSSRAKTVLHDKNAKDRAASGSKEHSIAAAFILQTYLDAEAFKRRCNEDCSS
jgi:putative Holliday junction resolvase